MQDASELRCKEKASYKSKKEASAAAVVAQWQHGSKLKIYLCKYCNLWHLASDY